MTNSVVSVCLITYNHVNYIREAIESVLMQKVNFSMHLYIADDFSLDGTRDVLLDYKQKNPDFITLLFQEKNVGARKNWIDLMGLPNSRYIAYFEADDYWIDPLKLQKQFDFMESHSDFSMCFHNTLIKREYKTLTENNKDSALFNGKLPSDVFELKDLADGWIAHTSSMFFVSKYLVPLPEWFARCFTGDLVMILLFAGNGKIKYLDFTGSVYRQNDGGISRYHHSRFLIEGKIEVYKLIDKHFNYKYTHVLSPIIGKYYYKLVQVNLHSLELLKASANFMKAFRLKPKGIITDFPLKESFKLLFKKLTPPIFKPKK